MLQSQTDELLVARMKKKGLHNDVVKEFVRRVELVRSGFSGKVSWNEVDNPLAEDLVFYDDLPEPVSPDQDLAGLVIIKLNGGLGTSMGLSVPKCVLDIHNNESFLYYMRKQILHIREKFQVQIPLLFMNSFTTRDATLGAPGIRDINRTIMEGKIPVDFLQNMVPRIDAKSFEPFGDGESDAHWCPPGHGDIFLALKISGILDRLIEAGFKTAFISNSDNLAATIDPAILSHFNGEGLDFAMEITPKTQADIKGGVLIRRNHGGVSRVELLEAAQVEDEYIEDFKDIERFSYFNTNNLWVNLESLRDRMAAEGLLLPVIINPKEVEGSTILQLETAMGAAIGQFEKTRGYVIPRSRFAPVKNCADLMVRRSDAYRLESDGTLVRNAPPEAPEPVVKLDEHYKNYVDFEKLVPVIPSLQGLTSLQVIGPVIFDVPISLKGKVVIKNETDRPLSIGLLKKTTLSNETVELK